MNYIVEIIKSLAWPISIIWLGYMFRSEVRQLLCRISSVKYKDLEASFEKGLIEAETVANSIPDIKKEDIPTQITQEEPLFRIAEISPRAAVVEAWTLIENAALKSGLSNGSVVQRVSPKMIIDYLKISKKFSSESLALIENLRKIRNQATHLPDLGAFPFSRLRSQY